LHICDCMFIFLQYKNEIVTQWYKLNTFLFVGIYCLLFTVYWYLLSSKYNFLFYQVHCHAVYGINHFIVAIWKVFIFPWLLMHQSNRSVPNPSFPTPGHFPGHLGIWTQTFAGGGAFEIKDLQVLQSSSTCAYAKKTMDMDFCVVFCEWDIDCMISLFPW
jgi:hypothetical protein